MNSLHEYIEEQEAYARETEAEIARLRSAVAGAAATERRQTQRRMIAALYWRAGVAQHLADVSCVFSEVRGYTGMRNALVFAARAMEAAL